MPQEEMIGTIVDTCPCWRFNRLLLSYLTLKLTKAWAGPGGRNIFPLLTEQVL